MSGGANDRRIEVGDEIVLPIASQRLPGRVIEDRGNLGFNGERILRIVLDLGEGAHEVDREAPEHALELA